MDHELSEEAGRERHPAAGEPGYQPIRPKRELKISGVVTAVVRKYR